MIDALRLTLGWALVWAFGIAAVAATTRPSALERPGERAWIAGCGFFVGAFLLTLWMRGLSLAGIRFSLASIGLPIAAFTIALAWLGWKRWVPATASREPMSRGERALAIALAAWLVFRFIVLLLDVIWTPLYPWDAWIQWATKSRVWYVCGSRTQEASAVRTKAASAWTNPSGVYGSSAACCWSTRRATPTSGP